MNLLIYGQKQGQSLDDFLTALTDVELCFYASSLLDMGFQNMNEVYDAIGRAMKFFNALHIPSKAHFKIVYLYRNGDILIDWLLSPMARKLVLLNADPGNPLVARIQLQLLEHL